MEPLSLTYSAENNECTFEEDIEENFMEEPCSSSNPTYTKSSMTVSKSPLKKYLEKAEKNLETQSAKLEMQLIEIDEINDKLHAANLAAGDKKKTVSVVIATFVWVIHKRLAL